MADDLSFLQEIDESLRADRLQQFWERFGNLVIAACAAVVLGTAASVWWKEHEHERHMHETSLLLQAHVLAEDGKDDDAIKLLEQAETKGSGIAALAMLGHAQLLEKQGKADAARAMYEKLAADRNADATLSRLARLQAGIFAVNAGKAPPATDDPADPFANSERELSAVYLLSAGKNKEAATPLKALSEDAAAPPSARSRAMELLATVSRENP